MDCRRHRQGGTRENMDYCLKDTACMASHAQATFNLPSMRSLQGGLKNTSSLGAKKNDFWQAS